MGGGGGGLVATAFSAIGTHYFWLASRFMLCFFSPAHLYVVPFLSGAGGGGSR